LESHDSAIVASQPLHCSDLVDGGDKGTAGAESVFGVSQDDIILTRQPLKKGTAPKGFKIHFLLLPSALIANFFVHGLFRSCDSNAATYVRAILPYNVAAPRCKQNSLLGEFIGFNYQVRMVEKST
jgi:hypothetical protein